MDNLNRYKRQITIKEIGIDGQKKLLKSKVLIVGMGAIGSLLSNMLARAGVGYLRIIDQDFIDETNLQRQFLFLEEDVKSGLSKVEISVERLKKINSSIKVDAHAVSLTSENIEDYIKDIDIILDGTDNFETRFLINDVAIKHGIPWVYGGVIGMSGASMNIVPSDKTPCFRCFMEEPPKIGTFDTCVTAGVSASITGIISSIIMSEGIKILLGLEYSKKYLAIDLFENYFEYIDVEKNKKCPTCKKKKFEFLENKKEGNNISLCGHNAFQYIPSIKTDIDIKNMEKKLGRIGTVKKSKYMLSFSDKKINFKLFKDGRAIIENVDNENMAKKIYEEYIGL